jgi:hypothetical protein
MLAFMAAPINPALACGGSETCCKKEVQEQHIEKTDCEKETEDLHSCNNEKDCGGECGKKDCHCPSTFSSAQFAVPLSIKLALPDFCPPKKSAWFYLHKIPKSIYLSIWLPPKISCKTI